MWLPEVGSEANVDFPLGQDVGTITPNLMADGPSVSRTPLDFTADPEVVRAVAEGERLAYGHRFNPAFATEISRIDPLPHQRTAVSNRMFLQPRLRFLLADEPGGGKTTMAG